MSSQKRSRDEMKTESVAGKRCRVEPKVTNEDDTDLLPLLRKSIACFYDAQNTDTAKRPLLDESRNLIRKDGWAGVQYPDLEDMYTWALEKKNEHSDLLIAMDDLFGEDPLFLAIDEEEFEQSTDTLESMACCGTEVEESADTLGAFEVVHRNQAKYLALLDLCRKQRASK